MHFATILAAGGAGSWGEKNPNAQSIVTEALCEDDRGEQRDSVTSQSDRLFDHSHGRRSDFTRCGGKLGG